MFNWSPIFTEASQANTTLVYLGIGSAMNHKINHSRIEDNANQQFPPFLNKFKGKKLVILFDPLLEEHLAVEKYLTHHNSKYEKDVVEQVRILRNDELVVFAINDNFDFGSFGAPNKFDWDVSNLIHLISICLDKNPKTKIILQDFTGRDTTTLYASMFNIFGRTELLNHVMFDVTQKDGGCFIEMNEQQAPIDCDGHFIQEKYIELAKMTSFPLFNHFVKDRIQNLIYPISHNYVNMKKDPGNGYAIVPGCKFLLMAHSYNMEFDELNTNTQYLIQKHEQLIIMVLEDIVRAKMIDSSAVNDLMSVIEQRSIFINSLVAFNYTS
jgi:hypothetical protein